MSSLSVTNEGFTKGKIYGSQNSDTSLVLWFFHNLKCVAQTFEVCTAGRMRDVCTQVI